MNVSQQETVENDPGLAQSLIFEEENKDEKQLMETSSYEVLTDSMVPIDEPYNKNVPIANKAGLF